MQRVQPRALNNEELLMACSDMLAQGGMTVAYQTELVRRFNYYLASTSPDNANLVLRDSARPHDANQKDLFI